MPKLAEFKVSFSLPAVLEQTDYLRKIVQEAVIPATQAGAEVFYKEVKGRASGISKSGNLPRAIYQYRDKDEQRPGHARYKISWRKGTQKQDPKAPSGLPVASHGILLEYGYIQRYVSYVGSDGQWYTQRKPGIKGKVPRYKGSRAPGARQAYYDKFYVLRETPVQHAPKSFLRAGFEAAQGRALEAARMEMQKQINKGMV